MYTAKKTINFLLIFTLISLLVNVNINAADETSPVKFNLLVGKIERNGNNINIVAGISLKLNKNWKLYSHNPGDLGKPLAITTNHYNDRLKINYPPCRAEFSSNKTMNFYQGEIIIPLLFNNINTSDEKDIEITVDYTICNDLCINNIKKLYLDIKDKFINYQNFNLINQHINHNNNKHYYNHQYSLVYIMIIAALGGFILNFMPCVLPVLSLKILNITQQRNSPPKKIRNNFLIYALGIVLSFTIIGIITLLCQYSGKLVGVGFQFQNPLFIIFLLWIVVIFSYNLLDLFYLNLDSITNKIANIKLLDSKNIYLSNFASGAFAVLLSTPCSAPFIGTAIGFALSRHIPYEVIIIFLSIGFGMALPQFALAIFPQAITLLPKPGKWMIKIKHFLGILLMSTALWLTWVLANETNWLTAILVFLIIISIRLLKKYCADNIKTLLKYIIVLFIISMGIPLVLIHHNNLAEEKIQTVWQDFNHQKLSSAIENDNIIIIDITADWCITCKYNKMAVLNSDQILDMMKENNIIGLTADLTNPHEEITLYLNSFNRYGIPLYVVYGPNAKNGIILSEILTKKKLIDAISKAK